MLASLNPAFDAMDQPTYDAVNTFVVSRAAKSTGLTVALSGLGADELFDGYCTRSDFIRHHVFPGGMLPSVRRFREEA